MKTIQLKTSEQIKNKFGGFFKNKTNGSCKR